MDTYPDEYEETAHLSRMHISHVALLTLGLISVGAYFMYGVVLVHSREAGRTATFAAVTTAPSATPSYQPFSATTTLRVLFVGDMFFDRHIRFVSSQQGSDYPFSCVSDLLQSADFVVGNMEGPITTSKSVSLGTVPGSPNNYRFTFPTSTATTLKRHNVRAVSLGNNHILNFGTAGLTSTHQYLTQAGVGYFGGVKGNEPVYRIDENGQKLSFVAYNEFGGSIPEVVAATVATESLAGRKVIVFAHWGDEYSKNPTRLRPIATLFADSGATLVIGAHPHVVGAEEIIGNTLVYYSLGNFIFDQYFSEGVRHGLAVMLTFSPHGIVDAVEYKTELKRDGRTCVVE